MPDESSPMDKDAARLLASISRGLEQVANGEGRVHTPQAVMARRRGRPVGSVQATIKEPVKLRLDADVLAALRASGDGWQTRINDTLRASLRLAGKV